MSFFAGSGSNTFFKTHKKITQPVFNYIILADMILYTKYNEQIVICGEEKKSE